MVGEQQARAFAGTDAVRFRMLGTSGKSGEVGEAEEVISIIGPSVLSVAKRNLV